MSLDRRSIEKRDFPTRLRGYDRTAVDAHLRQLADELEARVAPTADAAAEQVRAVLAAAERGAAEIVAQAQAEAQRIGSVAGRAGEQTTARASAAASRALERIEQLRGDLTTLLEALGTGAPAPVEDLPDAPVADAAAPAGAASSTAPAAPTPAAAASSTAPAAPTPAGAASSTAPAAPTPAAATLEARPPADDAGARLVVLELALSGAPRERAEQVLAEQFALGDQCAELVGDVYAAAGRG